MSIKKPFYKFLLIIETTLDTNNFLVSKTIFNLVNIVTNYYFYLNLFVI